LEQIKNNFFGKIKRTEDFPKVCENIMSFVKALIGIVVAIVSFLISSWGNDIHNNIIMVIFFLIAVVAFFYAIYEWKKGD
jgi:predicted membrane channel-forming protein YqfA (hemolysin III family)